MNLVGFCQKQSIRVKSNRGMFPPNQNLNFSDGSTDGKIRHRANLEMFKSI